LQIKKKELILLFADLLAIPLASEGFLHALLLTGLQVEGVALDFLDNVFGLHLALETAQSILEGFAFLNSNLCQSKHLQTALTGTFTRIPVFVRLVVTRGERIVLPGGHRRHGGMGVVLA
jgi:hypothetical protein